MNSTSRVRWPAPRDASEALYLEARLIDRFLAGVQDLDKDTPVTLLHRHVHRDTAVHWRCGPAATALTLTTTTTSAHVGSCKIRILLAKGHMNRKTTEAGCIGDQHSWNLHTCFCFGAFLEPLPSFYHELGDSLKTLSHHTLHLGLLVVVLASNNHSPLERAWEYLSSRDIRSGDMFSGRCRKTRR